MDGASILDPDDSGFVEVDPTGRYGRYNEILGKGSSKTVYRGFDEYEGIEVAWNQVKLYDFLQRPEDLERLYCEIHLLKTLKHKSLIKFYGSWIDSTNRNLNFVTEMFTSGTLREYRMKHKRVNIRAIKDWCRQILEGLHYLHSLDPPVIHRDLKCDNIFINGHQGQVKIGDLGLAAILRKSHAARCVGTPEFMAPEVYAEEYNELVDIYAFGMCILELVTFEYPYSECTHPAQIYKKVVSGKKPEALYKVKDPEVRRFVEKCLATVSCRLTAEELLKDPFLQIDYCVSTSHLYGPVFKQPFFRNTERDISFGNCFNNGYVPDNYLDYDERNEIDVFTSEDEDGFADAEIAINGRRSEDDDIFLRLRIADKEGRVRNIYFSFDTETDTARSVATEMVAELDITDQDVTKIANLIDGQITSLVPEWKSKLLVEENISENYHDCTSGDSASDYLCTKCTGSSNLQVLNCSQQGCTAVHGRFEEITYQFEEGCATVGAPVVSSMSQESGEYHYDEEHDGKKNVDVDTEKESKSPLKKCLSLSQSANHVITGYGNEVRLELRWLKAKYQMQLRGVRDQQSEAVSNLHPSSSSPDLDKAQLKDDALFSCAKGKHFRSYTDIDSVEKYVNHTSVICDAGYEGSCSPDQFVTEMSFYTEDLIPHSINRAISLPVDAADF